MSDTESFEHAMADMRKVVVDCNMERCDMYDGDCYQCQGDILDRMQRAHDRELAQARDPQRLRGTKPNTFDGAIEALREFRWQHATNDENAVPYINAVKEMHDHELEHIRKAEYARGYHDDQHSMDAEHYAVALRLKHLPLDGGSHENLSQIARAVYHADFGWTQGACRALRDELVRLMGGVHKPDAALSTYDVLGNERHKAVCRLREIQTDAGGFVKALANALGVEWQAPRVHQTIAEVRDRLIHLLGGDEPFPNFSEPNLPKSAEIAKPESEDGGEVTITDELRKWASDRHCKGISHTDALNVGIIADRIDEQFNRVCEQQEAVLQSTIERMAEENLTAKDERDYLRKQRDELRKSLRKIAEHAGVPHDLKLSTYDDDTVAKATVQLIGMMHEHIKTLEEKLDAIQEALDG